MSGDLLHLAIQSGDIEKVKQLLDQNAPVNHVDEFDMTALMWAASTDYVNITTGEKLIQILIKADASVDAQSQSGQTSLMSAALRGNSMQLQLLIEAGVNLNLQDKWGRTALMVAATHCRLEIVQLLLKSGASLDIKDNDGRTALMWAANGDHFEPAHEIAMQRRRLIMVRSLLKAGANLDIRDNFGHTAHNLAGRNETKILISKYLEIRENIKTLEDLRIDQQTYLSHIPRDIVGLIKNVLENDLA